MTSDYKKTTPNLKLKFLWWIGLIVGFPRTICTLELNQGPRSYGGLNEGESAMVMRKYFTNLVNFGGPYL